MRKVFVDQIVLIGAADTQSSYVYIKDLDSNTARLVIDRPVRNAAVRHALKDLGIEIVSTMKANVVFWNKYTETQEISYKQLIEYSNKKDVKSVHLYC